MYRASSYDSRLCLLCSIHSNRSCDGRRVNFGGADGGRLSRSSSRLSRTSAGKSPSFPHDDAAS